MCSKFNLPNASSTLNTTYSQWSIVLKTCRKHTGFVLCTSVSFYMPNGTYKVSHYAHVHRNRDIRVSGYFKYENAVLFVNSYVIVC